MIKPFSAIFLFLGLSLQAQVGGKYIYSFLDLPVPARTAALGGSIIAIKDDDINLTFQNPALLSSRVNNHLSMNFIKYLGPVKYGYLAYARSFDNIGHFAVGIQQVGYGTFSERDEYGAELGTFRANDNTINLSYCYDKDTNWSYGATVKTILSRYAQYSSVGSALDLGISYHKAKSNFTFGAVIRNIGYQWKTYTGGKKEKLPFNISAGISKKIYRAPFRLCFVYDYLNQWDLTYTDPDNPPPTVDPFTNEPIKENKFKKLGDKFMRHWIIGSEIIITKNFNLRVGYNYKRRKELLLPDKKGIAGISFGFGVKVYKFHFSYTYAQYSPVFGSNHFSITTNIGSFIRQSGEPSYLQEGK